MKIAQIAPLYEAVPPRLYGGTERVVAYLSDALVELGHDVTLFASAEACTKARLCAARDQAIRLDPTLLKSDVAAHLQMLHDVRKRAHEFDVLHFHIDLLHFPMFEDFAHCSLTTLHGRLDLKDLWHAYSRWPQYGLVSISDDQRRPLANANWVATIPHGIPAQNFTPKFDSALGYLAFVGRISPEKRPDVAINIARRTGIPIRIAAKVDSVDTEYFHTAIAPLLGDPLVQFVGEIGDRDKSEFLGNARALLFPIDWPEPFGLVMIEAMACGTPVIAWRNGSVPEVIDDGITGMIVSSEDQAIDALAYLPNIDRRRVRAVFENRFDARAMAQNYLNAYAQLAEDAPRRPRARIKVVYG